MGVKKVVGGLLISLGVMDKPFTDGMKRAGKNLRRFETGLGSAAKKLIAFGASYLAVRRITSELTAAAQRIDQVAKTSDKLGIATENLMGLQHAAQLSGVQLNQLNMGLQRMTRRIAEAAQGTGEAKNAIAELGLNAASLARMSPDKQFLEIAEAMGRVSTQSDRVRLGFKLFDSEGVNLINVMRNGRGAVQAMMRDSMRLGNVLTRDAARGVEDARDAMTRLKSVSEGAANQLIAQLAPAFTTVVESMLDFATEGAPLASKISAIMETMAIAGALVGKVFGGITGVIRGSVATVANGLTKIAWIAAKFSGLSKETIEGLEDVAEAAKDHIGTAADEISNTFDLDNIADIQSYFQQMREQIQKTSDKMNKLAEPRVIKFTMGDAFQTVTRLYTGTVELANMAGDQIKGKAEEVKDTIVKGIAEEQKKRRDQLIADQAMRQANFDFVIRGLRDIVSNSGASAKEQFKINKALALADITMSTASAIMKYHNMTPPQPGMAIAAGIIGAAQFAAVASTSFGGGGGTGGANGSMPMPEPQAEPSRTVNINLGDSRGRFSREEIMSIMDGVQEAVGDGAQFNFA